MASAHRHVGGWPAFGWPKNRQQLYEFADGQEWLRVEEFHDGDTLVVRAELPDIDPVSAVYVLRIHGSAARNAPTSKQLTSGHLYLWPVQSKKIVQLPCGILG